MVMAKFSETKTTQVDVIEVEILVVFFFCCFFFFFFICFGSSPESNS